MQVALVPAAAYLALYAPGHYLLRGRGNEQPAAGSRLFREVLGSTCCTSWFGFVLAELGLYSLPALLACLAGVTVTGALLTRGSRPARYGAADVAGLAVVCLTWLWVAPPLDTRILGSDSAGYLAAGVHLSRHGGLIIHDPTLPRLSPDFKRALFHSATENPGAPPYLRLPGALLLRSLDGDEVLPAFHHLIAVWVAAFHALAGSSAAEWTITLFAGLSVWAMVAFAAELAGGVVGGLFFALLSLSSVQNWYSRFLMPEIPGQFFVWGGLCCLLFWSRTRQRTDAALAGCAFGIAGLMRLENAVFLFVALTAALWLGRKDLHRDALLLLLCAAVLWAHAAAHLIIFRTHYLGNLFSASAETLALFATISVPQLVLLGACAAALLLWIHRATAPPADRSIRLLLGLAAAVALWGDWRNGWAGVGLLTSYIGIPTAVAGAAGLALYTAREDWDRFAAPMFILLVAEVFAQVMLAPHATPVPIWTVRRAATIVLPALCLGVAFLCRATAQRWHSGVALLVLSAALAGQAAPFAKLSQRQYYQGGWRDIEAIGALLQPGACLIVDAQLVGWGFDVALWAEHDLPAYLVSAADAGRIAKLVRSFDGIPVYWLTNSDAGPPRIPGTRIQPVALYEFTLSTPPSDMGSRSAKPTHWDSAISVYSLRHSDGKAEGAARQGAPQP